MTRIRLKDIAAHMGLSTAAVSMALNNHPRIGSATRARVKRVARKMGYRPDPALSALAEYRSALRPERQGNTLVFLTELDLATLPVKAPWANDYWMGCRVAARRLGYSIEPVFCKDLSPTRLSQILRARGTQGLVMGGFVDSPDLFLDHLDWSEIAVVVLGHMPTAVPLHCAQADRYRGMRLAWSSIRALGYRRPGLVLHRDQVDRDAGEWMAAHLLEQQTSKEPAVPPCVCVGNGKNEIDAWLASHKPDIIFTDRHSLAHVLAYERNASSAVPAVCLMQHKHIPCVSYPRKRIGEVGVQLLDHLIRHHQFGKPALPLHLKLPPVWRPNGLTPTQEAKLRTA